MEDIRKDFYLNEFSMTCQDLIYLINIRFYLEIFFSLLNLSYLSHSNLKLYKNIKVIF